MIRETDMWAARGQGVTKTSASPFSLRSRTSLPYLWAFGGEQSQDRVESASSPACVGWWERLERGLLQRFQALQLFMERLASGKALPAAVDVESCGVFRRKLRRLAPALCLAPGVRGRALSPVSAPAWTWLGSTDLLLRPDGSVVVLDQNFSAVSACSGLERLPELDGVSVEHSACTVRTALFPRGIDRSGESPVLLEPAHPGADEGLNDFLARCLGAERAHRGQLRAGVDGLFLLREGQRLRKRGLVRRIDDELLDPNFFRPDSLVGLPGLVRCWSAGETSILHAPGSSLLCLRSVVRSVPQLIREFLGEEPLIGTVPLLECHRPDELARILRNPRDYLFRHCDPVEPVRSRCGQTASTAELTELLSRIRHDPSGWCARPLRPADAGGQHLRVFASYTDQFRLLRTGLVQPADCDGGAAQLVPAEASLKTLRPVRTVSCENTAAVPVAE
ncbi:MAG: hypothetical protein RLZZ436_1181 [Planctomycetota bacterium]|jgi:uncharacterized circularly permuted ATP-grasp superfamily protein